MICNAGRSFVLQVAKGRTPKRPISVSFQHERHQHASRETTLLSVSHRASFRYHAFSTLNTNSGSSSNNTLPNQNRGGSILRASTLSAASAVVDDSVNQQMKTTAPIRVKQLFDDESSTYTYLLWDETTKDALLVDPVDTQVDRDLQEVNALGLNLVYAINTHAHADHITGTGILKQVVQGLQSVISENSGAAADLTIHHGDQIFFGHHHLVVRVTPGHTLGCVSLVAGDGSFVLTGDTLLVQGCGRTDFQGGSSETLWESVQTQLFSLPDTTTVYPAHDYKGRTHTTIGAEKETNPRLGGDNTKEDFVEIMNNLNLPYPKKLDVAVPANMRCGIQDDDGDI